MRASASTAHAHAAKSKPKSNKSKGKGRSRSGSARHSRSSSLLNGAENSFLDVSSMPFDSLMTVCHSNERDPSGAPGAETSLKLLRNGRPTRHSRHSSTSSVFMVPQPVPPPVPKPKPGAGSPVSTRKSPSFKGTGHHVRVPSATPPASVSLPVPSRSAESTLSRTRARSAGPTRHASSARAPLLPDRQHTVHHRLPSDLQKIMATTVPVGSSQAPKRRSKSPHVVSSSARGLSRQLKRSVSNLVDAHRQTYPPPAASIGEARNRSRALWLSSRNGLPPMPPPAKGHAPTRSKRRFSFLRKINRRKRQASASRSKAAKQANEAAALKDDIISLDEIASCPPPPVDRSRSVSAATPSRSAGSSNDNIPSRSVSIAAAPMGQDISVCGSSASTPEKNTVVGGTVQEQFVHKFRYDTCDSPFADLRVPSAASSGFLVRDSSPDDMRVDTRLLIQRGDETKKEKEAASVAAPRPDAAASQPRRDSDLVLAADGATSRLLSPRRVSFASPRPRRIMSSLPVSLEDPSPPRAVRAVSLEQQNCRRARDIVLKSSRSARSTPTAAAARVSNSPGEDAKPARATRASRPPAVSSAAEAVVPGDLPRPQPLKKSLGHSPGVNFSKLAHFRRTNHERTHTVRKFSVPVAAKGKGAAAGPKEGAAPSPHVNRRSLQHPLSSNSRERLAVLRRVKSEGSPTRSPRVVRTLQTRNVHVVSSRPQASAPAPAPVPTRGRSRAGSRVKVINLRKNKSKQVSQKQEPPGKKQTSGAPSRSQSPPSIDVNAHKLTPPDAKRGRPRSVGPTLERSNHMSSAASLKMSAKSAPHSPVTRQRHLERSRARAKMLHKARTQAFDDTHVPVDGGRGTKVSPMVLKLQSCLRTGAGAAVADLPSSRVTTPGAKRVSFALSPRSSLRGLEEVAAGEGAAAPDKSCARGLQCIPEGDITSQEFHMRAYGVPPATHILDNELKVASRSLDVASSSAAASAVSPASPLSPYPSKSPANSPPLASPALHYGHIPGAARSRLMPQREITHIIPPSRSPPPAPYPQPPQAQTSAPYPQPSHAQNGPVSPTHAQARGAPPAGRKSPPIRHNPILGELRTKFGAVSPPPPRTGHKHSLTGGGRPNAPPKLPPRPAPHRSAPKAPHDAAGAFAETGGRNREHSRHASADSVSSTGTGASSHHGHSISMPPKAAVSPRSRRSVTELTQGTTKPPLVKQEKSMADLLSMGVEHSGWLMKKNNSGLHNYKLRWVQLFNDRLRYFDDERCQNVLNQIELKDVQSIEIAKKSKRAHTFMLNTAQRPYTFAADNVTSMLTWMDKIGHVAASVHTDVFRAPLVEKCGVLRCRLTDNDKWKSRFFSLGENYLIQFADAEASQYYHSFWSFDAAVFNSMRIRMSETVVDLTECEASLTPTMFDMINVIHVYFANTRTSYYYAADTTVEAKEWVAVLAKAAAFNPDEDDELEESYDEAMRRATISRDDDDPMKRSRASSSAGIHDRRYEDDSDAEDVDAAAAAAAAAKEERRSREEHMSRTVPTTTNSARQQRPPTSPMSNGEKAEAHSPHAKPGSDTQRRASQERRNHAPRPPRGPPPSHTMHHSGASTSPHHRSTPTTDIDHNKRHTPKRPTPKHAPPNPRSAPGTPEFGRSDTHRPTLGKARPPAPMPKMAPLPPSFPSPGDQQDDAEDGSGGSGSVSLRSASREMTAQLGVPGRQRSASAAYSDSGRASPSVNMGVEKCGFLEVGHGFPLKFKKRWFQVFEQKLRCFDDRNCGNLVEQFDLDQVIRLTMDAKRTTAFHLMLNEKEIVFNASTIPERNDWLKALRAAISRFALTPPVGLDERPFKVGTLKLHNQKKKKWKEAYFALRKATLVRFEDSHEYDQVHKCVGFRPGVFEDFERKKIQDTISLASNASVVVMGVGLDGEVNCFQVLSNTNSGEVIAWTLAAPNGVELQGWVGEMRRIIMKKIDEADAKRKVPQMAGLGPSPLASSTKTVLTPELEKELLTGGDDASERKSDAASDYFTLRQKAVEEKAAERARVREYITMKRGQATSPAPEQPTSPLGSRTVPRRGPTGQHAPVLTEAEEAMSRPRGPFGHKKGAPSRSMRVTSTSPRSPLPSFETPSSPAYNTPASYSGGAGPSGGRLDIPPPPPPPPEDDYPAPPTQHQAPPRRARSRSRSRGRSPSPIQLPQHDSNATLPPRRARSRSRSRGKSPSPNSLPPRRARPRSRSRSRSRGRSRSPNRLRSAPLSRSRASSDASLPLNTTVSPRPSVKQVYGEPPASSGPVDPQKRMMELKISIVRAESEVSVMEISGASPAELHAQKAKVASLKKELAEANAAIAKESEMKTKKLRIEIIRLKAELDVLALSDAPRAQRHAIEKEIFQKEQELNTLSANAPAASATSSSSPPRGSAGGNGHVPPPFKLPPLQQNHATMPPHPVIATQAYVSPSMIKARKDSLKSLGGGDADSKNSFLRSRDFKDRTQGPSKFDMMRPEEVMDRNMLDDPTTENQGEDTNTPTKTPTAAGDAPPTSAPRADFSSAPTMDDSPRADDMKPATFDQAPRTDRSTSNASTSSNASASSEDDGSGSMSPGGTKIVFRKNRNYLKKATPTMANSARRGATLRRKKNDPLHRKAQTLFNAD